ncbi:MAG: hypothetical protein AABX54_04015 [Nanoarchaeota archaeon]
MENQTNENIARCGRNVRCRGNSLGNKSLVTMVRELAQIMTDDFMPGIYFAGKFGSTLYALTQTDLPISAKCVIGAYGFSSAALECFRFLLNPNWTEEDRIHPDKPYVPLGGIYPWEAVAIRNYFVIKQNKKLERTKE